MKPTLLLGSSLLLGIASFAVSASAIQPPAPATQPAAQPASEISLLIGQLGADDFHVRLDASRKLKLIGKPAMAALQEARRSQDPEVHARAEEILQELEHPSLAAGPVPEATGFGSQSMRVSFVNGTRIVDVEEPGRTIHIDQNNAGITMKVKGRLGGNEVTREFKAKNAEQLKKENPQAFALYQQFGGNMGQIFGQGNVVQFQRNFNVRMNARGNPANLLPIIPPAPIVPPNPNGDNIERLEEKLLDQMKANKLADAQQEEVKGLLNQLRQNTAQDVHGRMREYDSKCDALRKRLAELKLADPGDLLPPPAAQRLGVSALEQELGGRGLVIVNVLPDSRAAKMGLKEQDLIQKVNGQDVRSTHDLRRLVTENPKGLIVEGLRDGKPLMKVEEK